MKNLRLCSPVLGISPGSNSGGEVFDRELLLALADLGVQHVIYLPKDREYFRHVNFSVEHAPVRLMVPPYVFNVFVYRYLMHGYLKKRFDAIRVHSPYFVGLGCLKFKRRFNSVPLIVNFHHLEDNWLFDEINRRTINYWDAITVDSQFTKDQLLERYRVERPERIWVVAAGGSEKFSQVTSASNMRVPNSWKGRIKLLFLNGLKDRKNPLFLLELLKSLGNNYCLLVAGDGPLRGMMERRIKELGLENQVRLVGYVKEEDKAAYYRWADLLVLPSLMEGFGMGVIEAGSCGTPSVVSDRGSLPEVVRHRETGLVLNLDVNQWVREIRSINEVDGTLAVMGKKAKQLAESYTWRKSAELWVKVMEDVIEVTAGVR